tara:strand:+ start:406 stop:744 length:339 start_codon:yes stop_codon:yes gene_type:complete
MTTIEKQQFKITIPSIISIVTCTIVVIGTLYKMKDESSLDREDIKLSIQRIESNQEIVALKLQAQIEMNRNNYRRDSANTSNLFNKVQIEVKEIQSLIIRNKFSKGPISVIE